MTDDLVNFVRESNLIEGIDREPLSSEIYAHSVLLKCRRVRVEDLTAFVDAVQPGARLRDQLDMDVRVGDYVAPPGGSNIYKGLVHILWKASDLSWTPLQVHVAYEQLHPFTDGNGHSGRALWLWTMGGEAPLGFLCQFYYQTLKNAR